MPPNNHKIRTVQAKFRMPLTAFIVSFACALSALADEPPEGWIKRVAAKESATQEARSHYTYRQSVKVEDFHPNGAKAGEYGEVRDIIFLEDGKRAEKEVKKAWNRLSHIQLTDEDFRDLRDVQPMLLTRDTSFLYETRFKGEETIDGADCWLLQVRPRQLLEGQRLFEGMLWIQKSDLAILRAEGQAVPQIRGTKTENLFPHFTTVRAKVDGDHWFPVKTYGDDMLHFRTGSQRIRIIIEYSNYKRFGSESTITFEPPK